MNKAIFRKVRAELAFDCAARPAHLATGVLRFMFGKDAIEPIDDRMTLLGADRLPKRVFVTIAL